MKTYCVMCFIEGFNLAQVEVDAQTPEEAKILAIQQLKMSGYADAKLAPDLPGMPAVSILTPKKKKYGVMCLKDKSDFLSLCNLEVEAYDENEAREAAVEILKKSGYPNGSVAPDLRGMSAVKELHS